MQFTGVPWLREHLAGLLRELLAVGRGQRRPGGAAEAARRVDDLRGAVATRSREGGLVTAVAGPERKALIDRLQATMALIEGHAEHVMDAAGAPVLPNVADAARRDGPPPRDRPPLFKLLERLLGLDMKLRQYEHGKRFCDAVVARGGIDALNRAWSAPELLPTLAELDDPAGWIRRTELRVVTPPD